MSALRKDPGHEVPVHWHGRTVRAWVPALLAERDLAVTEATARRTERAAAALRRGSEALPEGWEALARLVLRAEGVASSFIEGVRAPMADVAVAELDPSVGEAARWVADSAAAARQAVTDARRAPLAIADLHRWHVALMEGTPNLPPHLVGAPRDAQGWVGGSSPFDAALVTPPPDRLEELLDDLVAFANRDDLDTVTQAAAAHAQFEVIHPYADGNGRIGRVLIGWVFARRLDLHTAPPVSLRIAADRGGYLSQMTRFRLGEADPWVRWFADTVAGAGAATVELVAAVTALVARWHEQLDGVRTDAAARRILDHLPAHPVLAAATVAEDLGVSERAGRDALETLAARGVVVPYTPPGRARGRPRRWWVAHDLLDLVSRL
jgi:Fic family protein